MARYVLTVDVTGEQLNDGPLITSPGGGAIIYHELREAEDAARALVQGGTVKGAYVQLLRPVAFYMPDMAGRVPDTEPAPTESN